MPTSLCVSLNALTDTLKMRIARTAQDCGIDVTFLCHTDDAATLSALSSCDILFTPDFSLLRHTKASLRWFATPTAGVDKLLQDPTLPADCMVTNAAGAYGLTISEHLLMVALMLLRNMPVYIQDAQAKRWGDKLPMGSIHGSRLLILGTGDLGTTFAKKAKALGCASIVGVNRRGQSPDGVYDAVHPLATLDDLLPHADIVLSALPDTPQTHGLFDAGRLALLPARAIFLNVGRGSVLDQDALVDALHRGTIAGAALDVTTPEPLPADHPLWSAPNLILTPHIAGNMTLPYTVEKAVALFCDNLIRYAKGEVLHNVVDRHHGY